MLEYEVYKIIEWRDGALYKTKRVATIWLPCEPMSDEQQQEVARKSGGDILSPTGKAKF